VTSEENRKAKLIQGRLWDTKPSSERDARILYGKKSKAAQLMHKTAINLGDASYIFKSHPAIVSSIMSALHEASSCDTLT